MAAPINNKVKDLNIELSLIPHS